MLQTKALNKQKDLQVIENIKSSLHKWAVLSGLRLQFASFLISWLRKKEISTYFACQKWDPFYLQQCFQGGKGGGHKRLLLVSCSVSVVVIQSSTQCQQTFPCCTVCLVWLALGAREVPYAVGSPSVGIWVVLVWFEGVLESFQVASLGRLPLTPRVGACAVLVWFEGRQSPSIWRL